MLTLIIHHTRGHCSLQILPYHIAAIFLAMQCNISHVSLVYLSSFFHNEPDPLIQISVIWCSIRATIFLQVIFIQYNTLILWYIEVESTEKYIIIPCNIIWNFTPVVFTPHVISLKGTILYCTILSRNFYPPFFNGTCKNFVWLYH